MTRTGYIDEGGFESVDDEDRAQGRVDKRRNVRFGHFLSEFGFKKINRILILV
jgi:hypothetical protein